MKVIPIKRKFVVSLFTVLALYISFLEKGYSVNVPGTTVDISAPKNFTVSQKFSGFENRENNSSIVVSELPAEAFPGLSKLFSSTESASQFAQKGINITGRETVNVGGNEVAVLLGEQSFSGVNVAKYLVLLKGEKTVLITFNIADSNVTTKSDVITSIKSVALTAMPTLEEQIALLNYVYKEQAPFKTAQILQGTTAILTTFEGVDTTGAKPIAVIAMGNLHSQDLSIKEFAEQLVVSTQGFAGSEILESKIQDFSGTSGYFTKAVQDDRLLLQYLSIQGDQYLRLISLGEKTAIENLQKEIIKMASSVEFKGE